jgi:hypothetical protein
MKKVMNHAHFTLMDALKGTAQHAAAWIAVAGGLSVMIVVQECRGGIDLT